MGYRDPLEALQAENESLRSQLRDAHDEIAGMRDPAPGPSDAYPHRWALGMRCLGGVAMMLPFLLMTAVCERRASRSPAWMAQVGPARAAVAQAAAPAGPAVAHSGCRLRAPLVGFERFSRAVERSTRVTESRNFANLAVGSTCTVRVAPVSLPEFNCHVDVRCANGQALYGTLPTGYAHCDVDGENVLRAYDADYSAGDGDPAVTVDLTNNRVVVEDRAGESLKRAVLAVDVPR